MGILIPGGLTKLSVVGLRRNLVQPLDTHDDRCQCGRNLRILYQRGVFAALYVDVMQLGVEGFQHLAGGGREIDHAGIVQDTTNLKAVRLEPCGEGRNILRRSAETGAEFRRGQPLVIFRRARLLLARYQIIEVGLLRGAALQQQKEVQGFGVFHRTKVRRPSDVLTDIPFQGDQDMLVDGVNQT